MKRKKGWIVIIIAAFIVFFVGMFLLGYVSDSPCQMAGDTQFLIGRYTVAGAVFSDGYSSIFMILDTMTGDYQVINVSWWKEDRQLRISSSFSGKVE